MSLRKLPPENACVRLKLDVVSFLKKTVAVTIMFLFLISTAAAANVKKLGYDNGYKNGYNVGTDAGEYDCMKYAKSATLRQVPNVVVFPRWSVSYKNGYESGYAAGFVAGYHLSRFVCLRRA